MAIPTRPSQTPWSLPSARSNATSTTSTASSPCRAAPRHSCVRGRCICCSAPSLLRSTLLLAASATKAFHTPPLRDNGGASFLLRSAAPLHPLLPDLDERYTPHCTFRCV